MTNSRLRLVAFLCSLALVACTTAAVATPAPTEPPVEVLPPAAEVELAGSVPVELHEEVRVETYAVRGRNATDVRGELNRTGPYSFADGRRFDALTAWSLTWTFRYERDRTGPGCRLASARIDFSVVVTLPALDEPQALSPRSLELWQAYIQSLEEHEAGHVERQRQGALALQSVFSTYEAPWQDCRELRRTLDAEGQAQINAIHAEDRRYDAETGHGRTQGAVFP